MFGSSGSHTSTGSKVVLNVYDLGDSNNYTHEFGIGAYHSGVQIGGREYTFAGGSGVFFHEPKVVPGEATFRESIEMGTYAGSTTALEKILDALKPQFSGDSYNIVAKNCNHFSDAFVYALLNVRIPGYVNRLANLGNMVSCLLPPSLLNQAPVGEDSEGNSGGSSYHVITPRNRHAQTGSSYNSNISSSQVFSRTGFVLGEGSTSSASSSSATPTGREESANDRREKMRAAALNRLHK